MAMEPFIRHVMAMEPFIRHVVAVPYPGRGHVNSMINVCKLLASRQGLLITFVLTDEWLGLIGSPPTPPNLRFRTIRNVIPSELGRGADFAGFIEAVFHRMGEPFDHLLDRLEQPISCILADTYLPWAVSIGNRRNIPVASFWPMSPTALSIFYHHDLIASNLRSMGDDESSDRREERVDYIPGVASIRIRDLPFSSGNEKTLNRALQAISRVSKAQCLILTSFYEIETHATDSLRSKLPLPIYPVGPTIPYMSLQDTSSIGGGHVAYFSWLDSQPRCSVIYVSLGSFLTVSGPQMDEFSAGLHSSGVRFLWVRRGDSTHPEEATVINGGMGLVVPWCEQLRVLSHPSIGGFLTHCGWNSTMEAVFAGVPMITFPIFWDQLTNAKTIVDDWKVGIRLRKEVGDDETNVVKSDEIAKTVRRLMDLDGDESKEVRRRGRELQESCKSAIEMGGSSVASLGVFVRDVVRG